MITTASEETTAGSSAVTEILAPSLPWADVAMGSAGMRVMTSQELLLESSLDWDVALRPLYRRMNDSSFVEHARAKEVYRTDTEASLGVVRGHYHPWSNREAFSPWDVMVSDGEGIWQEAGSQRNGGRVFMTMKLTEEIMVKGDSFDYYLFIGVGHDGYVAINPSVIPIRRSTVTHSAIGNNSIRVQHTPSLESKKSEVSQVQGLIKRYKDFFIESLTRMADTLLQEEQVLPLLERVMNPKRAKRSELAAQIMEIYVTSQTIQGFFGTGYGVFCALTEWQCHVRKHRMGNARFDSLMWGEDAKSRNNLASEIERLRQAS